MQFKLWTVVAASLGVRLHQTVTYNLQANGLCEWFHCSMKAGLRVSLPDENLLGLHSAPKEDLSVFGGRADFESAAEHDDGWSYNIGCLLLSSSCTPFTCFP